MFNEPEAKETELYEGVQAGCRQAGIRQGYTCGEAAQRLGIARSNVTRWVRLHQCDHPDTESDVPRSELENEIRCLRRENQRL